MNSLFSSIIHHSRKRKKEKKDMLDCLIVRSQEYLITEILYQIIEFRGNARVGLIFFLISATGRLFVLHLRDPFLVTISGSKGHFSFGVRTISRCFLLLKFSDKDIENVRMQVQLFKFNMILIKK